MDTAIQNVHPTPCQKNDLQLDHLNSLDKTEENQTQNPHLDRQQARSVRRATGGPPRRRRERIGAARKGAAPPSSGTVNMLLAVSRDPSSPALQVRAGSAQPSPGIAVAAVLLAEELYTRIGTIPARERERSSAAWRSRDPKILCSACCRRAPYRSCHRLNVFFCLHKSPAFIFAKHFPVSMLLMFIEPAAYEQTDTT